MLILVHVLSLEHLSTEIKSDRILILSLDDKIVIMRISKISQFLMRVTLQHMCLKPMGGKEPQYIKSKGKRETLNTTAFLQTTRLSGPQCSKGLCSTAFKVIFIHYELIAQHPLTCHLIVTTSHTQLPLEEETVCVAMSNNTVVSTVYHWIGEQWNISQHNDPILVDHYFLLHISLIQSQWCMWAMYMFLQNQRWQVKSGCFSATDKLTLKLMLQLLIEVEFSVCLLVTTLCVCSV